MFSPRGTQLAVFESHVALAAELGLPMFVHLVTTQPPFTPPPPTRTNLPGTLLRECL